VLRHIDQQASYSYRKYSCRKQQGTVLIIALVVVALIVGIASRFTSNFQLTVARTEQGIVNNQLQQFLYSAESLASWVLIQDADQDNEDLSSSAGKDDNLKEDWATEIEYPFEEALISGKIEDALSRFNLNSLQKPPERVNFNPNGQFNERYSPAQQRFIRLLQTHPDEIVDTSLAKEITESIKDWLDADGAVTGSGGAEHAYYQSLATPYRIANQLFVNKTELRLVKGITKEIYEYIAPLVIALPDTEVVFNLNTAPIEIIRTINSNQEELPISEEEAQQLIASRPKPSSSTDDVLDTAVNEEIVYTDINAFLESADVEGVFSPAENLRPNGLGIKTGSEYFLLMAGVKLLSYERSQTSLLKREPSSTGFTTKVIRRTRELF